MMNWFKKKISIEEIETKLNEYEQQFASCLLDSQDEQQIINSTTTDGKSLSIATREADVFQLIESFAHFYHQHYRSLAQEIQTQKDGQKMKLFIKMSMLYNETSHYAFFMLHADYVRSYEQQKNFIENKAFLFLLHDSGLDEANILSHLKIHAVLSILCIQNMQDISKQKCEYDLKKWFKEIKETPSINTYNFKMYCFAKALENFLVQDLSLSRAFLEKVFQAEMKKYAHHLSNIALQYTGLGNKPYLTMPLPNEFKSFVNETFLFFQQREKNKENQKKWVENLLKESS